MKATVDYTLLGRRATEPAGEAFDKAARLLVWVIPAVRSSRKPRSGKANIPLPKSWIKAPNDFSFSGIKSSLLRLVTENKDINKADFAASFQAAVVDVLVTKTLTWRRNITSVKSCWPGEWPPINPCARH